MSNTLEDIRALMMLDRASIGQGRSTCTLLERSFYRYLGGQYSFDCYVGMIDKILADKSLID